MHTATARTVAAPIQIVRSTGPLAPAPLATLCSSCHLKDLCLPCGLGGRDLERLDELRFARRRVQQGDVLFRAGDRFEFVYAVRSGTFKTSLMAKDGREQVTGFQMAGEILGLDGLAQGAHPGTATALEDAEICAIPYAHLTHLAGQSADVQMALARLMSREIVREHSLMMLLGSMSAEERLAAFLLNISQRMKARGYSGTEFHLRMSRAEMGSYLGIKLETVSRTLSSFQQQGLVAVDKKHIRILDLAGLQRLVDVRVH